MDAFFTATLGAWAPILINVAMIAGISAAVIHRWGKKWRGQRTTLYTAAISVGVGCFAHALPGVLLPDVAGWQGWATSAGVGLVSFLVGAGFSPLNVMDAVKREKPEA